MARGLYRLGGILYTLSAIVVSVHSVSDYDALMDLYNSTLGATWTDNSFWSDSSAGVCSWYGVTCTGDAVTMIKVT